MKRNILFILCFLLSTMVFGQREKLEELFEQYQESEGVTSIKIAKPMFKLLSSLKISDDELSKIQPLLSKVNGLKILIVEKDSLVKLNNAKLQKQINQSIKNMKFEELMTIKSAESNIKFLTDKANADVLDNLLLSITSDESEILMMLDGMVSMKDVSTLVNEGQEATYVTPKDWSHTANNSSKERKTRAFHGVDVSSGIQLIYSQANQPSVIVDADADKLQYIVTEVDDGILKVFINSQGNRRLNFNKLSVRVANPVLNELRVRSGATFKTTNTVTSKNINITTNSGAQLRGSFSVSNNTTLNASSGVYVNMELDTKGLTTDANSGSYVKFSGLAENATYNLSSGSVCVAEGLKADNVTFDLSSASSLTTDVKKNLSGRASSGSSVSYKGNPTNTTKTSSGATISSSKK